MDNLLKIPIILLVLMRTCSSTPNYGPFHAEIYKLDFCAGPKNKNCTTMDLSETKFNGEMLSVNFKVLENISPTNAKIVAMSKGKELVRLQMNKPCDHLFLRPLLESLFTISKSCMILKNDYKLKINIDEMSKTYFGGKFFYGSVNFRSVLYGSECNFCCINLFLNIKPTNKKMIKQP